MQSLIQTGLIMSNIIVRGQNTDSVYPDDTEDGVDIYLDFTIAFADYDTITAWGAMNVLVSTSTTG